MAGYDCGGVGLTVIGPRNGLFGGRALIFCGSVHRNGDLVDGSPKMMGWSTDRAIWWTGEVF